MVKFLREREEKIGRLVKDKFFNAITFPPNHGSMYIPGGGGIVVCTNIKQYQYSVTQVIFHDLIHAFDDCRAENLNWTNCVHHACSQIISNHLSGDYHFKRLKLRGHEPECIKRVLKSLSANPFCASSDAKKLWVVCY